MVAVNAFSVVACLLSTSYVLKTNREHLVYFGYVSFMLSWTLISCFYNDLGIYNMELFRYTETTSSTVKLAGFYMVFNFGFFIASRLTGGRPLARIDYAISRDALRAGYFKLLVYAVVALVMLNIMYAFVTEGFPLLSGISRVEYFEQSGAVMRSLVVYGSLIAFFLGYFIPSGGRFSVNAWIMAAFVLFIILMGHKFSLLFSLIVAYYAPVYARYIASRRGMKLLTWKRALGAVVVVVILLSLAFGSYRAWLGDSSRAYTLLVNRVLAFQGELWWAVDHDVSRQGRYDRDHWMSELDNVVSPGDTPEGATGMKYVMVKVLGPEKAYAIFDSGYLYTMAYPAILIATFPYSIAVVLQCLAGMVFFAMLYYLYYSILYRHTVRVLITLTVLFPYIVMLFTGNFHTFFTPGMAIKISVLLILEYPAFANRTSRQESVHT